MKRSKNYVEAAKLVDKTKVYDAKEAMSVVLSTSKAKFDETVELHVKLGVDGRNADQQVRGVVVLPEGTGKSVKVLVIAKGDKAEEAKKAGADIVGDDAVIAKIMSGNWLDFDVCITTPDMMGALGRCARILGPKGLMPNPKSGTVTMDVTKAIKDVISRILFTFVSVKLASVLIDCTLTYLQLWTLSSRLNQQQLKVLT